MYINYNDFELLYLYKEGIESAQKILFEKYDHYLRKTYYEKRGIALFSADDYFQEGRMVLLRAMDTYNEQFKFSFFRYFTICFFRQIGKWMKKQFKGPPVSYLEEETKDPNIPSYLAVLLQKELKKEETELFEACFLQNVSVADYSRIHHIKREQVQYRYKKLQLKMRKKVDEIL